MATFNAQNPDDRRVAYYSVAGRSVSRLGADECRDGRWPNPGRSDILDPLFGGVQLVFTATSKNPRALEPMTLLRSWATVARHPTFWAFSLLSGASYGGLFTFLASSSFVFIEVLGLRKTQYGLLMFSMSLSYISGTVLCRQLLPRFGVRRTVAIAGTLTLTGGSLLGVLALLGLHTQADVQSGNLSHGDQKLLDIALALVLKPKESFTESVTLQLSKTISTERIANKTLAIDFTLGLEQGTGAEADWMAEYRYQGISALNAWQGDRAIEQIAGYQQRLRRLMVERGIQPEWLAAWNGWLREEGGRVDDGILAWAQLGRKGGEAAEYTRQLLPLEVDGVPHWLWTTAKPADSLLNFWLALDNKTFPAETRSDLGFAPDASRPIAADDLLAASKRLIDETTLVEELRDMRRPLLQGASAISAGFLGADPDRRAMAVSGFRLLQLRRPEEAAP